MLVGSFFFRAENCGTSQDDSRNLFSLIQQQSVFITFNDCICSIAERLSKMHCVHLLTTCSFKLSTFESVLPALNKDVCGADSAPCDALCGGPGSCGYCGGRSCLAGSVSKAEQALQFADEADRKLNEKQKEAEEVTFPSFNFPKVPLGAYAMRVNLNRLMGY